MVFLCNYIGIRQDLKTIVENCIKPVLKNLKYPMIFPYTLYIIVKR
jgi:hypothetical protein